MFTKIRVCFLILVLATTIQIALTSPQIITKLVDNIFKIYIEEREKSEIAEKRKADKEKAEQEKLSKIETKPTPLPSPSATPIMESLSANFPLTAGSLENSFVGKLLLQIPADKKAECGGISSFTLNGSVYETFPSGEGTILRRRRFEHNPEYEILLLNQEGKVLKGFKFEESPSSPVNVTTYAQRKKGEPLLNSVYNANFTFTGLGAKIIGPRKIFQNQSSIEIGSFLLDDIQSWLDEKRHPKIWDFSDKQVKNKTRR